MKAKKDAVATFKTCPKCHGTGKFEWSLVGPDGKVHYTRESFAAITAVALH